jgi:hypothetical protein
MGAVPPRRDGGDEDIPWDYQLRAAVFEAWSHPDREESWYDHAGYDPDDPAEAHRCELRQRWAELDFIFNKLLEGKPLTCFHSSHLWMLRLLFMVWHELLFAGKAELDGMPPPPWHRFVPAEMVPPEPDEKDPWLKARRAEGYVHDSHRDASGNCVHTHKDGRVIPDPD